ncbi:Carboxyl-terminal protease [Caenispirillum salinarum AK4]|uniref:Carboxyl-terminal protease n=1 Tax=Caenispirillum salinarum AK4 TaxID=1238182 RepID=K9H4A2_9PROT|nr:S41 family peptidase [Caenispirillum salinarum]EKV32407.1 Carboxyl-terminal protease [Caenispirillum salinarum AK4]
MKRKLAIAATALAFLSVGVPTPQAAETPDNTEETYRLLDLFGDVFERVRRDYVEEVGDQELIEAAINGMLTDLDPHSSYLNADNFKDMQVQTRGEFGGLGIEVTMENGLIKVVSPIDDTPAFRAGLQPGDLITHIGEEEVIGLSLQDAVDKMRGPVDTDLTLTIRRDDQEPFEVTLTRAIIEIRSVRSRREGDIGYLRVTSFSNKTYDTLEEAIDELKEEIGPENVKGWVLDLRNNPGGLLDQAVAVSDAFLESGEIVSTRARDADETQRFNAREGDLTDGKPIVVLINDGSASASEIVAGALQDHRRAIVLGTKSFGKGSVQTIVPLPGHGAMRLTTARYYTPSGRSIQALGIEPDIRVKQAVIEEIDRAFPRRSEASLRGALDLPQDAEDEPAPEHGAQGETDAEDQAADADGEGEDRPEDYQLTRALDLLRGLALYDGRQG